MTISKWGARLKIIKEMLAPLSRKFFFNKICLFITKIFCFIMGETVVYTEPGSGCLPGM